MRRSILSAARTPPERAIDLNDIRQNDWVERWLPQPWRPYARLARLDRPIGTWLTLLPCLSALVQAADGWPSLRRLMVFSIGALIMRSAGSTINDIADREFDGKVERTRFRPLATGSIGRRQAVSFLALELTAAALLLPFLETPTVVLAVGLLPLVVVYPYCKRFTYWPQILLGAAFNWGMLMAWSDTRGIVPFGAVAMWLGALAWQVGYDTVYAYVDAADDARLGLKSTALLFGGHGKVALAVIYGLTALLWTVGGLTLKMGWLYFVGVGCMATHLIWQVHRFDLRNPAGSFGLFRANVTIGVLLLTSAVVGSLPGPLR